LKQKILHFTLGPVQGFVAQARRTRDLWSGSFLLSYLAGQAMYTVIKAGGKILFPAVQDENVIIDPLLKAIQAFEEKQGKIESCIIGSLPNRFKAELPEDFHPDQCVKAVKDAWERLAREVWDRYVREAARYGKETEVIWQRQVDNFWDIAWVVSSEEDCNDLLDRRKNWRSNVPPLEGGDKCTIMGNWQELSGFVRCQEKEKKAQDFFWTAVRGKVKGQNLRPDERLCAIALIKRMFPEVAARAIGWEVPLAYPSTTYLAAVHWLEKNLRQKPQQAYRFGATAAQMGLVSVPGNLSVKINCINKAAAENPQLRNFAALDGNLFFKDCLQNDRLWPNCPADQRKQLINLLEDFDGRPSPYYAVLLMDGDSLGSLLQTYKDSVISQALAGFSSRVEGIVQQHNGILLYAGGDDVLALLPLEDALGAAVELRRCYQEAFRESGLPAHKTTISASIIYAHCHAALKSVLNRAHWLLDEVAKDTTGRDSLDVNVWRTGGPGVLWSAPWEIIIGGQTNLLDEMIELFTGKATTNKHFNSSFFYNVKKRFEFLFNQDDLVKPEDQVHILAVEYLKNREREAGNLSINEVKQKIFDLLKLCRVYRRVMINEGDAVEIKKRGFTADGALLVRFLAEKGVYR